MAGMTVWEAVGGIAGGGSAAFMLGVSMYDRFRRSIRAHALDGSTLGEHNARLTSLEKSMEALARSQNELNTAMVRHIGVDDTMFKNIDDTFARHERSIDQLRAQLRLDGAVRADETMEIHRRPRP